MEGEGESDNFYITLPSNTKSSTKNVTGQFRVDLPRPVYLIGNWTVAAVEVQFPFSFFNVERVHTLCTLKTPSINVNFNIEPGSYTQPLMLPSSIQNALNRVRESHKEEDYYIADVEFGFDFTYNRYFFKSPSDQPPNNFVLSDRLAYIMGFEDRVLHGNFVQATYPPDFTGGMRVAYVCCDVIAPQIIGNGYENLLRTVNISKTSSTVFGDNFHYIFERGHYMKVNRCSLQSISCSIKNDINEPIRFNYGTSHIVLHFKRERMKFYTSQ